MDVVINGICGRMGQAVCAAAADDPGVNVVGGIDSAADGDTTLFRNAEIPVFKSPGDFDDEADAIIDFSHYTAVPALLDCAVSRSFPVVVCTTGLGEREQNKMREAARSVPVFNSPNMSLGIAAVKKMAQIAVPPLERDFSVEIVEAHHRMKKDSPSGTALMLADAVNEKCEVKKTYVYGRHGKDDEVKRTDLGIHAVRGGTIPGKHTILFAGPDETIEVTHTAYSRDIFARGALAAALFLIGKAPGLYSMDDLV